MPQGRNRWRVACYRPSVRSIVAIGSRGALRSLILGLAACAALGAPAGCGGDDAPVHPPIAEHPDRLLPDAGRPATPGAGLATTGFVPCDVDQVLKKNCALCHGATPLPTTVPIASWSDLMRAAKSGLSIAQEIDVRVHATGAEQMPPSVALGPDDLATLDGWVAAGSPPGTAACD
jgi:hypothetical protein